MIPDILKIDGKEDLNPECRMCGQDPGSISHIMSTIDKYKVEDGEASSIRLWANSVKNKQKKRMSTVGQTMQQKRKDGKSIVAGKNKKIFLVMLVTSVRRLGGGKHIWKQLFKGLFYKTVIA